MDDGLAEFSYQYVENNTFPFEHGILMNSNIDAQNAPRTSSSASPDVFPVSEGIDVYLGNEHPNQAVWQSISNDKFVQSLPIGGVVDENTYGVPSEAIDQQYRPNVSSINPATAGDDEIDDLVTRVGSLQVAEDGELRFFGATSNLHVLQHRAPFSLYCGQIRTVNRDTSAILRKAGLDQKIPRELEDHLIDLYLTWEDPATHVVDRSAFLQARTQVLANPQDEGRLPSHYSELLVNAMFVHLLQHTVPMETC